MPEDDRKQHYQKPLMIQVLREFNKNYTQKLRTTNKNLRKKHKLKQLIFNNQNIFQLASDKLNRKYVQKVLWEKNYQLKMGINILKQHNNTTRAKLWNISKENRKMDKQIQVWGLYKLFKLTKSKKKPYIDMLTVLKVLGDQDYQIVSMKIQIARLQNIMEQKQFLLNNLASNQKNIDKFQAHISYAIGQNKSNLLNALYSDEEISEQYLQTKQNYQQNKLTEIQCSKEMLIKNIELKKKRNQILLAELETLYREQSISNDVLQKQDEIEKLKQETRQIKLQERNQLKQMNKQLKRVQQSCQDYQYQIQQMMGNYIKKKIKLKQKIYQQQHRGFF